MSILNEVNIILYFMSCDCFWPKMDSGTECGLLMIKDIKDIDFIISDVYN